VKTRLYKKQFSYYPVIILKLNYTKIWLNVALGWAKEKNLALIKLPSA
jgi:hypothetical protein